MKKIFLLSIASMALLAACGNDVGTSEEPNESSPASSKVSSTTTSSKEVSSEVVSEVSDSDYEGEQGKYVIKDVEQMNSQYDDNVQIVAITLDYTNTTDEPQNPWFAWVMDMSGKQETENTIEILDGANGLYPEDYKPEAVEMADVDIKPGATVEVVVGYELLYPGNLLYLRNSSYTGKDGDKFERVIETTAE